VRLTDRRLRRIGAADVAQHNTVPSVAHAANTVLRGHDCSFLATFSGAALFAFAMSLIRFLFVARVT
jgi:hypothetical protein